MRAVTRKAFTAAVARAMEPGCKYDTMLILSGPQGIGKSTLLDRMSKGWFNDGIRTLSGGQTKPESSSSSVFVQTDSGRPTGGT